MNGYDDMGALGDYLAAFSAAGDVPTSLSGYGYGQRIHNTSLGAMGAVMQPGTGVPDQPAATERITAGKVKTAALQVYLIALQVPGVKRTGTLDSQTAQGWDFYTKLFKEPHANIAPDRVDGIPDLRNVWITQQALGRLKEKAQASGRLEAAATGKITAPKKKTPAKTAPIPDPIQVPVDQLQEVLLKIGWAVTDPSGLIDPNTGKPDGKLGAKTRSKYVQSARKRKLNATIGGANGATAATVSAASYKALRIVAGMAAAPEPPAPTPQDRRVVLETHEAQSVLKRLGYPPERLSDGKTGTTTEGAWKDSASKRGLDPFIAKAAADLKTVRVSEKTYLMLKADADAKVSPGTEDGKAAGGRLISLGPNVVQVITGQQLAFLLAALGVPPDQALQGWKTEAEKRGLDSRMEQEGDKIVVFKKTWDALEDVARSEPPPGPAKDELQRVVDAIIKRSTGVVKADTIRGAINAMARDKRPGFKAVPSKGPWKGGELREQLMFFLGLVPMQGATREGGATEAVKQQNALLNAWRKALTKGVLVSVDGNTVKLPPDRVKDLQTAAQVLKQAKKAAQERLRDFTEVNPAKIIESINALGISSKKFDPSGGPPELGDAIKTFFDETEAKPPAGDFIRGSDGDTKIYVRTSILVALGAAAQIIKQRASVTKKFRDGMLSSALKEATAPLGVKDFQQSIKHTIGSVKKGRSTVKLSSREQTLYAAVRVTGAFDKATRDAFTEVAQTRTIGPLIQEYQALLQKQLGPGFKPKLVREVQNQVWNQYLESAVRPGTNQPLVVMTLPQIAQQVEKLAALYRQNVDQFKRDKEEADEQKKVLAKAVEKSKMIVSLLDLQEALLHMARPDLSPGESRDAVKIKATGVKPTGFSDKATRQGLLQLARMIFPSGYVLPETMWMAYLREVGILVENGRTKKGWRGASYVALPQAVADLVSKNAGYWERDHGRAGTAANLAPLPLQDEALLLRFRRPSVITVKKPGPKEETIDFDETAKAEPTKTPKTKTVKKTDGAAAQQAQAQAQKKTDEAIKKTQAATQKQAEAQQAEVQAQQFPQDAGLRQEADRKHQEAGAATQEAQSAAGEAQAAQDVATQAGGAQVTGPTITGPTIQITLPGDAPLPVEKAGMFGGGGGLLLLGAAGLAALLLTKGDKQDESYGT